MTDSTPVPQPTPAPTALPVLTVEYVLELEQKLRENKQAQLRGDPLPHNVTPEMLRDAISSIRMQRGTLPLQKESKGKKGGGKASVIEINLDL